jgi:hypothetical protein
MRFVAGTQTANVLMVSWAMSNTSPPSGFVPLVPVSAVASATLTAALTRLISLTHSIASDETGMTVTKSLKLSGRVSPGSISPR